MLRHVGRVVSKYLTVDGGVHVLEVRHPVVGAASLFAEFAAELRTLAAHVQGGGAAFLLGLVDQGAYLDRQLGEALQVVHAAGHAGLLRYAAY